MKLLIPLIFLANLAYAQAPCFPGFERSYYPINHFEFNSLFNSESGFNIDSGESGDTIIHSINDFTTSISIGETYSMQVASEYASIRNKRFTAWIDFNNDEIFGPDEVVLDAEDDYINEMITIPIDSTYIGIRRLRIMMAGGTDTLDACGQYEEGESEDYFITITDSYVEPCYCTPFVAGISGQRIEDFNIGEIFNCDSGNDNYSFYPDSIFTTDLEIGKTYRMLVSQGTLAGGSAGFRVSIDFNDNRLFDADESVLVSPDGPGIIEKYVTIPNDTSIIGQHRMRARASRRDTPPLDCTWADGETEDYIINIIPQDTTKITVPDWQKIMNIPGDQRVTDIIETYDNGYVLSLIDDTDSRIVRLIKFSIDGDTLWSKNISTLSELNYPSDMSETLDGGFIICGLASQNDNLSSYVVKLNACGDHQWGKYYGNPNRYDYPSNIIQTADSNYVVLQKYLNDTSRIALSKLNSIGNIIWQSDFTYHHSSEPRDLIETSYKGFLITGSTYTPNPGESPNSFFLRSMIIKIDSYGNEEWEKVLGIRDTISIAYNSVELETGGFLVLTSMQTDDWRMGVYRVDEKGIILFYKEISDSPNSYRLFIRKMQGDNYCIVSSLQNGCFEYTSMLGLYMINSNGTILDASFVEDHHLDIRGAVVTKNNKLIVAGSKDFIDNHKVFMFKFNEDLEFDALYNTTFDYDWLCNSNVIHVALPKDDIDIDLYPNPTSKGINIQINESNYLNYDIKVTGLNGAILKNENIHSNELKNISLDGFNPGMYIITISLNNNILSSRKIFKSR